MQPKNLTHLFGGKMKRFICVYVVFLITLMGSFGQEKEILELKEKIIDIQNKSDLGFQNFTLCSKIFGFAYYVPLPEPVLNKSATLLIYYEPANVFTSKRNGLYEIWYTQDMILMDEEGKIINEWKDFLSFKYTSKKPVLDLFAENSIELDGQLPPGKYKFKAVLNDKLRGESVTKIIELEIR